MNPDLIQNVTLYALPVLFAITLHEAAHAYAARRLGDNTASALGRVTLNPLKHIDPIGTIAIPLLLYFATSGAFLFGYAKPVPINASRLRQPRRDMVWVALAGPAANFVQAALWAVMGLLLAVMGVQEAFFIKMAQAGVLVNLVLWAFNLFPLPPLDGGRILLSVLPYRQAQWLARIEPWGFFVVLGLAYAGVISQWWLLPLITLGNMAIQAFMLPLRAIFG
jgi:Zn-dependent protease